LLELKATTTEHLLVNVASTGEQSAANNIRWGYSTDWIRASCLLFKLVTL